MLLYAEGQCAVRLTAEHDLLHGVGNGSAIEPPTVEASEATRELGAPPQKGNDSRLKTCLAAPLQRLTLSGLFALFVRNNAVSTLSLDL